MQTSERFRICALLSFSGGLQDAYTYNVRGHVFANAQTGNVVLISQNLMTGNWRNALHYILPLMAFAAGVFIAERVEHRFKRGGKLHWRQIIIIMEIVMLFIVGFLPGKLDMAANILVSLSCAMQVQTFRTVHGFGYASTMCIGNLRSGTENLSVYLRDKDTDALFRALYFFGIIIIFAIGAGIGGVLSLHTGRETIWLSVVLLAAAALIMKKKKS